MTLPEPARTLWKQHHKAIDRIAKAPGGESRTMLGGGSVLAARWNHRESTDIDILLPDRDNVADAAKGAPLDLAAATGGRHQGSTRERLVVVLENGKLDVAAIPPQLPGLERRTDVEGRPETVLDNAQILRGKFYRTDRGVTRDAFDVAVAAEEDPRALEVAVNSLDETKTRTICHNLLTMNDDMVEDAKTTLRGVPSRHEKYLNGMGDAAADAAWNHRYGHVEIRMTETVMEIETTSPAGGTRTETYERGRTRTALAQSGIGAYIAANSTLRLQGLESSLDALGKKGWGGVAFDSHDVRPEQRLKEARISAGLTEMVEIGEQAKDPATAPDPATATREHEASRDETTDTTAEAPATARRRGLRPPRTTASTNSAGAATRPCTNREYTQFSITAVPLSAYENGPGTLCAGMIGIAKRPINTGEPSPWLTIVQYSRRCSSWCRDMSSRAWHASTGRGGRPAA